LQLEHAALKIISIDAKMWRSHAKRITNYQWGREKIDLRTCWKHW